MALVYYNFQTNSIFESGKGLGSWEAGKVSQCKNAILNSNHPLAPQHPEASKLKQTTC